MKAGEIIAGVNGVELKRISPFVSLGDPKAWFKNQSPWGDDAFVLMRTTFEIDSTDFDYVRIRVLANHDERISKTNPFFIHRI
jgi:hypothetical protein